MPGFVNPPRLVYIHGSMSSAVSSPFDSERIARAFAPLLQGAMLHVHEVLTGNINTILKVESSGRLYGVRVRTNETVYRYEPDLIKEVFALWLLQHGGKAPDEANAAEAFARIRDARRGMVAERHDALPTVRYFDWSREHLPHPYCIYDWVEGEPLWNCTDARLYALAGETLARIHRVQFSAFYADFLSIGVQPVNWQARFRAALHKELADARRRLPSVVAARLESAPIPTTVDCAPRLVHNDFAPGNILVRAGAIAAVIDWDNAVIDAPHIDFIKMKYWTAKNAEGELFHEPRLFSAFVDGYGQEGRDIVNSSLFTLYEILWLLRVYNFERAKEEQKLARAPGYPAAAVYEQLLAKAVNEE